MSDRATEYGQTTSDDSTDVESEDDGVIRSLRTIGTYLGMAATATLFVAGFFWDPIFTLAVSISYQTWVDVFPYVVLSTAVLFVLLLVLFLRSDSD